MYRERNSGNFLTCGEQRERGPKGEIAHIVERAGCCTKRQLLNYLLKLHEVAPHLMPYSISMKQLSVALEQMRAQALIQVQGSRASDIRGGELDRVIYSTRFPSMKAIDPAMVRRGDAMIAAIIPFLPDSKAVYPIDAPLSFTFLSGNTQVEIAIIEPGKEIITCAVLDKKKLPKSVNKEDLVRIAVVSDRAAAGHIMGGGFCSVCVVEKGALRQVRSVPPEEAWDTD